MSQSFMTVISNTDSAMGYCWLLNLLLAEFSDSYLQVILSLILALETIASS